jgi:tetratricopeptide (TPR) repeat protein
MSHVALADDAAEARDHYKKATAHFAVGEFADAANEYESAFKLKQDAALLFNAAQSRRLAGQNEKALVLYKNYLQLYPKAKNVADVKEQITKLQEAITAAESAKTAPPTNTVEPSNVPPPAETHTEPAQQQAQTQPPPPETKPEKTPIYKKWWLWTIVGVVVIAAVVIPVAIIESSPGKWGNVPDQGPGATSAAVLRW